MQPWTKITNQNCNSLSVYKILFLILFIFGTHVCEDISFLKLRRDDERVSRVTAGGIEQWGWDEKEIKYIFKSF